MDKRRVEGGADNKMRMERRLPAIFLGSACTGKSRKQHPVDIRRSDSAAFVHATHLTIMTYTPNQPASIIILTLTTQPDRMDPGDYIE